MQILGDAAFLFFGSTENILFQLLALGDIFEDAENTGDGSSRIADAGAGDLGPALLPVEPEGLLVDGHLVGRGELRLFITVFRRDRRFEEWRREQNRREAAELDELAVMAAQRKDSA